MNLPRSWILIHAHEVGRTIAREVSKLLGRRVSPSTRTIIIDGLLLDGEEEILYEVGSGRIDELLIVTNSKTYYLTIIIDGKRVVSGTYDGLIEYADELKFIEGGCNEEKDEYILKLENLNFSSSIRVRVSTSKIVRFKKIVVKYTVL